ncbi:MAG: hypothetical protein EXS09_02140 [Gemmataceae bacterium]|nr:hypothetical protein [Gemmataceae bacterium]
MKILAVAAATLTSILLLTTSASAQITGSTNGSGYAPNMSNRSAQPLSPYLNLLRGGNTAVNYFYGVRPGTQPSAFSAVFGQSGAGPRMSYFPGADTLADFSDDPRDASKVAPTGHGTTFNNTLNYFGPTSGQYFSRGAQQQRRR